MRNPLIGLDLLLAEADRALRTLAAAGTASRPNPGADAPHNTLTPEQSRHAASLMRVNHAGEIAAQALYQGQALTARNPAVRDTLRKAADEEGDHLAWCAERLNELGSRTSLLNPLWYAGAFTIGAVAGVLGDRISLGFVAETERQVEGHLEGHLKRLPPEDARSRRILEQMKTDEVQHGQMAQAAGGTALPAPVPQLMRMASQIMTRTAYWF
jgi:ubiquinone biosynthesis monooxygenase Coq7